MLLAPDLVHGHFPHGGLNRLLGSGDSQSILTPVQIEDLIPALDDALVILGIGNRLGLKEGKTMLLQFLFGISPDLDSHSSSTMYSHISF